MAVWYDHLEAVAILHGWESNPASQGFSHPNNTRPTARFTACRYRATVMSALWFDPPMSVCIRAKLWSRSRISTKYFRLMDALQLSALFKKKWEKTLDSDTVLVCQKPTSVS